MTDLRLHDIVNMLKYMASLSGQRNKHLERQLLIRIRNIWMGHD